MTCVALARLKASIQNVNSMKLSLTGCSVPWITKTSRPRTFSRTRTKTLPLAEDLGLRLGDLDAEVRADRPGEVAAGPAREDLQLTEGIDLLGSVAIDE